MQKLYLIPGIGADGRLFHNLDISAFSCQALEWTDPDKNDTLETYAAKLLKQINQEEPFILIGVSLGGMLAIEIAKQCQPQKTILISSAKTRSELPLYLRIISVLKLHRIFPASLLGASLQLVKPFFGKMSKKEFDLFRNMFDKVGEDFVGWAKNAIMEWDNKVIPPYTYHIHGTKDKVLPIRYIKNCIPVGGGEHYMVVTKAKVVSQILADVLAD